LPGGELANETGLSFRQAVFLGDGRIYDLGEVAAGATFAPRKGAGEDALGLQEKWRGLMQRGESRFDNNSHEDIKRLLATQTQTDGSYPLFAGLAEAPALGASLGGQNFTHRQYIIVVVSLRGTP
jgi:hypothetical protein